MSERITNGTFDSNLSGWVNGPGTANAFTWSSGRAMAEGAVGLRFRMYQTFTISHEVIDATLNAAIDWAFNGTGAYVEFWIEIEKPDTSRYQAYHKKWTASPGPYQACNNLDITSELTQQGNYKLDLICDAEIGGPPPPAIICAGYFDNISLDVAIKRTKMVKEDLGTADTEISPFPSVIYPNVSSGITLSDGRALSVRSPGDRDIFICRLVSLSDSIKREIGFFADLSDSVTLTESSDLIVPPAFDKEVTENVGLSDILTIKKTVGNVETTYNVTDITEWTERTPADTDWDKYKVEIL